MCSVTVKVTAFHFVSFASTNAQKLYLEDNFKFP